MTEPKPPQHDQARPSADADRPDVENLLARGGRPDPAPIARVREKVMAQYGDALAAGAFLAPRHQAAHARRYLARFGLAMGAALAVLALVAGHSRSARRTVLSVPRRLRGVHPPVGCRALAGSAADAGAALDRGHRRRPGRATRLALQAAWTAYQADLGDLVGADGQPGSDPAALQHVLDAHAASLSATAGAADRPGRVVRGDGRRARRYRTIRRDGSCRAGATVDERAHEHSDQRRHDRADERPDSSPDEPWKRQWERERQWQRQRERQSATAMATGMATATGTGNGNGGGNGNGNGNGNGHGHK